MAGNFCFILFLHGQFDLELYFQSVIQLDWSTHGRVAQRRLNFFQPHLYTPPCISFQPQHQILGRDRCAQLALYFVNLPPIHQSLCSRWWSSTSFASGLDISFATWLALLSARTGSITVHQVATYARRAGLNDNSH